MADPAAEAWQKVRRCASNALCVFTVRSRPFAQKVLAVSQVSLMSERPPLRHVGAPLRSLVTKETSLHRTATSFRHEPQVCQVGSFTARPTGSFSHVPPLSPLLCRMLLRRMVAALAASTVTITSAIEVVVAGAIGSRIDDSFSSIGIGGLPRDAVRVSDAAQAALWRP